MQTAEYPYAQNLADLFASDSEEEVLEEPYRDIEETPVVYELFGCDIDDLEVKDNLMAEAMCLDDSKIEQNEECWAIVNYTPPTMEAPTEMYGVDLALLSETLFYYYPKK